jgi:hypothetical protein
LACVFTEIATAPPPGCMRIASAVAFASCAADNYAANFFNAAFSR